MNNLFPCKNSILGIEYLLDVPLIWNWQGGLVHDASMTRYDVIGNFNTNSIRLFTRVSMCVFLKRLDKIK